MRQTLSVRYGFLRLFSGLASFLFAHSLLPAQSCAPTATNLLVHSEGLAERVGDVLLTCSGTPGATFTGNLNLFLNTNVTNRLSGNTPDVSLTFDSGTGAVLSTQLSGANNVTFNGLSFTIPASGAARIHISNIRANVNALGGQPVIANLASTNLLFSGNAITLATPQASLLLSEASTLIRCYGSPLPAAFDLASLFSAGTRFSSTRITEGFATAFQVKDAMSDTGTRIVVNYASLPPGARLFVPDEVAGSSALQATAGGDLGMAQSGGSYAPSTSGSLLLARVNGADANGTGGAPVYAPGPVGGPAANFNTATEIPVANGAASVTYEVVDANPSVQESAQFPTFIGIPAGSPAATSSETVLIGPVSTVGMATAGDPVPRFAAVPPASDCSFLTDCNATYFPQLTADVTPLQFAAAAGGAPQTRYVRMGNAGAGVLDWKATVTYQSGADWITVNPPEGQNSVTIRVDAHPERLGAGTYQATLLIDGGPLAGSRTVPITLTVGPAVVVTPAVTVSSVVNAASFQAGPVAAGSLATIQGTNLGGKSVTAAFDGIAAAVLYSGGQQINLLVPSQIAGKTSSQLVVTADGVSSAPFTVTLAPTAPGIFQPGILNQDNSVNAAGMGAAGGSIIQIYATGVNSSAGAVTVTVHDQAGLVPLYAGPAPGIPGLEQVNVLVPGYLPAVMTHVKICVGTVCSAPAPIQLR